MSLLIAAPPPVAENTKSGSANSNHVGKVVGITMSACVVLIFILMLVYFKRKKTPTLITSMDREGNCDFLRVKYHRL